MSSSPATTLKTSRLPDTTRRMISCFFLLLLVTTALTQNRRRVFTPIPSAGDTIPVSLPTNTFSASMTNLPYVPLGCANEIIPRISPKEMQVAIDSAFIKEGLKLTKDTLIQEEGLCLVLDGYNAKFRIGYVLLDRHNFAEDAKKD